VTGAVQIVIPVKGGPKAKSRLSPLLGIAERLALAKAMAAHVISTACASVSGSHVTVVTGCDEMALLALNHGARIVHDPMTQGTATACLQAIAAIGRQRSILFLSADLPLVNVRAIESMIAIDAAVVIAPDRHQRGTNGLLIRPNSDLLPSFGEGSFERHCTFAKAAGTATAIVDSAAFALDIDTSEDLTLLRSTGWEQQRRAA